MFKFNEDDKVRISPNSDWYASIIGPEKDFIFTIVHRLKRANGDNVYSITTMYSYDNPCSVSFGYVGENELCLSV